MGRNKSDVQFTFRLSTRTLQALEAEAKRLERSPSYILRRMLESRYPESTGDEPESAPDHALDTGAP